MLCVSASSVGSSPVPLTASRSAPAKSTIVSRDMRTGFFRPGPPACWDSTSTIRMAWERELWEFRSVHPTARFLLPLQWDRVAPVRPQHPVVCDSTRYQRTGAGGSMPHPGC